MKKTNLLIFLLLNIGFLNAQNVTITPSGITPAVSASYPRVPYETILAYPNPSKGDIVYDNTFECLRVFNGTKWLCTYQAPGELTPNIMAMITDGGNASNATGEKIAIDVSGNIYVTGVFSGTGNFGSISITSTGGTDTFLAKFNSAGIIQWVNTFGGDNTALDLIAGLALDATGGVFIIGSFAGTCNFGTTSKTSAGGSDVFVAKYNSNGTLGWIKTMGGTSNENGGGIATDAAGGVYFAGDFLGTATFENITEHSVGGYDVFVGKYDTNGTLQWLETTGGTGNERANGVDIDATGKVYVAGQYDGSTSFGTNNKTSAGDGDIFVAKYDPIISNWNWLQSAGGTELDYASDIAVDDIGTVYIVGNFGETANFGSKSVTSAGGFFDVFLAKYNTNGTIQWVKSIGGEDSDYSHGIALDNVGDVYISGEFKDVSSFGGFTKASKGGGDIFVAKYNSSGTVQWVQTAGGTGIDDAYGIAIDTAQRVFLTGYFSDNANFGASVKTTSAGRLYVARLDN